MAKEIVILDENYKSILAYEDRTSQIITSKVLEKPELSAWMILLPIVFILHIQRYQKYKDSSKAFKAGYLYTKKIALDIAYRIFNNEISREEALVIIMETVQKNPKAEAIVLNIYDQQIEEIKLLIEHYLALLDTKEYKYDQMVVSHYKTEDNYISLVNRLTEIEKQVTNATTATFLDAATEVPEIMEKMERHLLEYRIEQAKHFFSHG